MESGVPPHQTPTDLAAPFGSYPAPNASAWMSRLRQRLVLRLTPPKGESVPTNRRALNATDPPQGGSGFMTAYSAPSWVRTTATSSSAIAAAS